MNLTQKQWNQVLGVIEQLNNSLDDSEVREKAGLGLLELLSADFFASYIWDQEAGEFSKPVFINMSPENLRVYEQYYQFHDPITHKMRPFKRPVSVNEVIEQKELISTEFFNDFLNKDGLYHGINLYVYDSDNSNIGDLRIWRSRHRENFGQQEQAILDLITPHFRNAMRNIACAKYLPPELNTDDICKHLHEHFALTRRELDVAMALLTGDTDKTISLRLHISMPTLRTHIQHIYAKLDVNNRTSFCNKALFHRRA
jgi:DNA-binding CsgD family transcriptional regulator